jgi:hypothetical protein
MAAAVPPLLLVSHQPQIGFVHECRGLQRLPRLLLGQPAARFRNSS